MSDDRLRLAIAGLTLARLRPGQQGLQDAIEAVRQAAQALPSPPAEPPLKQAQTRLEALRQEVERLAATHPIVGYWDRAERTVDVQFELAHSNAARDHERLRRRALEALQLTDADVQALQTQSRNNNAGAANRSNREAEFKQQKKPYLELYAILGAIIGESRPPKKWHPDIAEVYFPVKLSRARQRDLHASLPDALPAPSTDPVTVQTLVRQLRISDWPQLLHADARKVLSTPIKDVLRRMLPA
jgi:hypothetical protein